VLYKSLGLSYIIIYLCYVTNEREYTKKHTSNSIPFPAHQSPKTQNERKLHLQGICSPLQSPITHRHQLHQPTNSNAYDPATCVPHLPPKPPHNPPQLLLRLLRPRRQSLTLPLLDISTHHAALLRPLGRTIHGRAILRHLHALLVRARLACTGGRKVLRRRVCVVIHGRGFGVRAGAGALCVRGLLALRVVGLFLGVEGEVILGDLAVAFAFRVGYEELFSLTLARGMEDGGEGKKRVNGRQWNVRDGIPTAVDPFLTVALRGCSRRRTSP
jgi:hypothetical protein